MVATKVPRSAAFAFDTARDALGEQLQRIDSLDSKAGILLAADGILAGLIFGRDSFTSTAPAGVAIAAGFFLLVSLAAAERNRGRLQRKARWLVIGQSFLLVSLAPLGGYFIYDSIRRVM